METILSTTTGKTKLTDNPLAFTLLFYHKVPIIREVGF
jgi:hypothetical protein